MPSRDAAGKRLPGAQQRSLAAIRRGDVATASPSTPAPAEPAALTSSPRFLEVAPPPIAEGVDAVAGWFGSVLAVCVDVLGHDIDVKGVLVSKSIKAAIKLQGRATFSEAALKLRRMRLGRVYDLTATARPPDDLATHAWAFCRLAGVIYDICRCEDLDRAAAARYQFLVGALCAFDGLGVATAAAALKAEIEAD